MPFYAHSPPPGLTDGWQLLADHLQNVAHLAMARADEMKLPEPSLSQAAFLAGLLLDLGKYRKGFQDYIHDLSSLHFPFLS